MRYSGLYSKNNFPGVILGLSGGIDSALTLAIACDSIGAKNVRAVMMPFKHTSTISKEDAAEQASMLGVNYDILPINTMYDAFSEQLRPIFSGKKDVLTLVINSSFISLISSSLNGIIL